MVNFRYTVAFVDNFSATLNRLQSGIKNISVEASDSEKHLKSLNRGLYAMTAATTAATGAMSYFASDFEQAMARLETVTEQTNQTLNKSMNDAADNALQFSTQWTASATQVIRAQFELATAGVKVEEQLAAVNGAFKLARATVGDFTETTLFLGSLLNTFGTSLRYSYLDPVEKVRVLTDALSLAIQKFQATIPVLIEGFKFIVGPATMLNLKFEEMVTALGILNTAGFRGTIAGTAMGNMFNKLQRAVEKLDLNPAQFTDLQGDLTSTVDFLDAMSQSMKNLTPLKRLMKLIEVFDIRAGRVISTLIQNRQRLRELTLEMELTTGATERLANIVETTTKSQFIKLLNVLRNIAIVIGTELNNAIRPLLSLLIALGQQIQNLFRNFSNIASQAVIIVTSWLALRSVVVLLGSAFGRLAAMIVGVNVASTGAVAIAGRMLNQYTALSSVSKLFMIGHDNAKRFTDVLKTGLNSALLGNFKNTTKASESLKNVQTSGMAVIGMANTLASGMNKVSAIVKDLPKFFKGFSKAINNSTKGFGMSGPLSQLGNISKNFKRVEKDANKYIESMKSQGIWVSKIRAHLTMHNNALRKNIVMMNQYRNAQIAAGVSTSMASGHIVGMTTRLVANTAILSGMTAATWGLNAALTVLNVMMGMIVVAIAGVLLTGLWQGVKALAEWAFTAFDAGNATQQLAKDMENVTSRIMVQEKHFASLSAEYTRFGKIARLNAQVLGSPDMFLGRSALADMATKSRIESMAAGPKVIDPGKNPTELLGGIAEKAISEEMMRLSRSTGIAYESLKKIVSEYNILQSSVNKEFAAMNNIEQFGATLKHLSETSKTMFFELANSDQKLADTFTKLDQASRMINLTVADTAKILGLQKPVFDVDKMDSYFKEAAKFTSGMRYLLKNAQPEKADIFDKMSSSEIQSTFNTLKEASERSAYLQKNMSRMGSEKLFEIVKANEKLIDSLGLTNEKLTEMIILQHDISKMDNLSDFNNTASDKQKKSLAELNVLLIALARKNREWIETNSQAHSKFITSINGSVKSVEQLRSVLEKNSDTFERFDSKGITYAQMLSRTNVQQKVLNDLVEALPLRLENARQSYEQLISSNAPEKMTKQLAQSIEAMESTLAEARNALDESKIQSNVRGVFALYANALNGMTSLQRETTENLANNLQESISKAIANPRVNVDIYQQLAKTVSQMMNTEISQALSLSLVESFRDATGGVRTILTQLMNDPANMEVFENFRKDPNRYLGNVLDLMSKAGLDISLMQKSLQDADILKDKVKEIADIELASIGADPASQAYLNELANITKNVDFASANDEALRSMAERVRQIILMTKDTGSAALAPAQNIMRRIIEQLNTATEKTTEVVSRDALQSLGQRLSQISTASGNLAQATTNIGNQIQNSAGKIVDSMASGARYIERAATAFKESTRTTADQVQTSTAGIPKGLNVNIKTSEKNFYITVNGQTTNSISLEDYATESDIENLREELMNKFREELDEVMEKLRR